MIEGGNKRILRVSTARCKVDLSREICDELPEGLIQFYDAYGFGELSSEVSIAEPRIELLPREAGTGVGVLVGTMSDGFEVYCVRREIVVIDKRVNGEVLCFQCFDAFGEWVVSRDGLSQTEFLYFDSASNVRLSWGRRSKVLNAGLLFERIQKLNATLSFPSFFDHAWWWKDQGILLNLFNFYGDESNLNLIEFSISHDPAWNFHDSELCRELGSLFG